MREVVRKLIHLDHQQREPLTQVVVKFSGDPSAFLVLSLNQPSIYAGKRFFGLLAIGHVHTRTNVTGKGAIFMESWYTDVEHPSILAVVPSQTAFFPKGLPPVERLAVNLTAFLVVLGMNNSDQAGLEISLRAAREVPPKLVEIGGLFVGSGHPDHHRGGIGHQPEAFLAFAQNRSLSLSLFYEYREDHKGPGSEQQEQL
jgi:hypothetical protein